MSHSSVYNCNEFKFHLCIEPINHIVLMWGISETKPRPTPLTIPHAKMSKVRKLCTQIRRIEASQRSV
jgi:hypothetical protein